MTSLQLEADSYSYCVPSLTTYDRSPLTPKKEKEAGCLEWALILYVSVVRQGNPYREPKCKSSAFITARSVLVS